MMWATVSGDIITNFLFCLKDIHYCPPPPSLFSFVELLHLHYPSIPMEKKTLFHRSYFIPSMRLYCAIASCFVDIFFCISTEVGRHIDSPTSPSGV